MHLHIKSVFRTRNYFFRNIDENFAYFTRRFECYWVSNAKIGTIPMPNLITEVMALLLSYKQGPYADSPFLGSIYRLPSPKVRKGSSIKNDWNLNGGIFS